MYLSLIDEVDRNSDECKKKKDFKAFRSDDDSSEILFQRNVFGHSLKTNRKQKKPSYLKKV